MTKIERVLCGLMAAVCLFAASCHAPWSEERTASTLAVVDQLEQNGGLTAAQAAALRDAINEVADGTNLEDILGWIGTVAGSVLLAFFSVQKARGPSKPLDVAGIARLRDLVSDK